MSAQETVPGQAASTWDLMASMTSKPRRELALGAAFFSPVSVAESSRSTDASHPCTWQGGNVHVRVIPSSGFVIDQMRKCRS